MPPLHILGPLFSSIEVDFVMVAIGSCRGPAVIGQEKEGWPHHPLPLSQPPSLLWPMPSTSTQADDMYWMPVDQILQQK